MLVRSVTTPGIYLAQKDSGLRDKVYTLTDLPGTNEPAVCAALAHGAAQSLALLPPDNAENRTALATLHAQLTGMAERTLKEVPPADYFAAADELLRAKGFHLEVPFASVDEKDGALLEAYPRTIAAITRLSYTVARDAPDADLVENVSPGLYHILPLATLAAALVESLTARRSGDAEWLNDMEVFQDETSQATARTIMQIARGCTASDPVALSQLAFAMNHNIWQRLEEATAPDAKPAYDKDARIIINHFQVLCSAKSSALTPLINLAWRFLRR